MRTPLLFLAIPAFALLACKRGGPPVLSESYPSKNGLITAHYPADFAASTVGTSSIVLSRKLPGDLDEALVFLPIENPISSDLREFARVLGGGAEKQFPGYLESASIATSCAGRPGIETTGTWRSSPEAPMYTRKACYFMDGGHGYSIAYLLPSSLAADEEPTLHAIREATQFNR